MSKNNSALDGSLEFENRELATRQVRKINDTLRKVRRISRESQASLSSVEPASVESPLTHKAPLRVQEVYAPSTKDSRRERDDSTDKFLIPEPKPASIVTDVFKEAFALFEQECIQFNATRDSRSPVVKRWKLL